MHSLSSRRILRGYIRVQCILLCLILGALGVIVVRERTGYLSSGTRVAAQWDLPVSPRTLSLPELRNAAEWRAYLSLLPAPVGNTFGTLFSIEELLQTVRKGQW